MPRLGTAQCHVAPASKNGQFSVHNHFLLDTLSGPAFGPRLGVRIRRGVLDPLVPAVWRPHTHRHAGRPESTSSWHESSVSRLRASNSEVVTLVNPHLKTRQCGLPPRGCMSVRKDLG